MSYCRFVLSHAAAAKLLPPVRTTVIPLWPVDYLQRDSTVCEARQCIIFFGLPRGGVRTNPLEPPLPTGLDSRSNTLAAVIAHSDEVL